LNPKSRAKTTKQISIRFCYWWCKVIVWCGSALQATYIGVVLRTLQGALHGRVHDTGFDDPVAIRVLHCA